MASINGITIKSLKSYKDHEGADAYQGNVYMDGKKLGFWSQDSWGGPDRFDFDEKDLKARIKDYYTKNPQIDSIAIMKSDVKDLDFSNLPKRSVDDMGFMMTEIFMSELLDLIENEKYYKKALKKGYKCIGIVDYYPVKAPRPVSQIVYANTEAGIKEAFKEETKKYPYAYITSYMSVEDFAV